MAGAGPDAYQRDGSLRLADGLWVVGDPAGPELHTHQAHYQGELVVRMALGEAIEPDYRALPRATYMDPEAASVGVSARRRRREAGLDAFECVADFPKTAKGYSVEAETGHVTIVVDRATRTLVGAAMACPDASAAIHECVVAIKARVPVDVLAETIHAFPSTSRIFNGLFAEAKATLDAVRRQDPATTSPSTSTSRGRACHSAPPVSTGSATAAAGSTTRSARTRARAGRGRARRRSAARPGTRPGSRATAGARCAGPKRRRAGRPVRAPPGSRRRRSPATGRRARPARRCRTG